MYCFHDDLRYKEKGLQLLVGGLFKMWIITVYSEKNNTTMFEFAEEKEAREAFDKIKDSKILSEVVYSSDCSTLVTT